MDIQDVRQFLEDRVVWLGQSGLLITTATGRRIYIDPPGLPAHPQPADSVFLTHSHGDHHSPHVLKRIRKPETRVIATPRRAGLVTTYRSTGFESTTPATRIRGLNSSE